MNHEKTFKEYVKWEWKKEDPSVLEVGGVVV
jgi:hypothetical protein